MTTKQKLATAGAAVAIATATLLVIQPPSEKHTIAWDYPFSKSNVVFIVRSIKTNTVIPPSIKWPVVSVTTTQMYTFTVDKSAKCVWFAVTASNTSTKLESEFAKVRSVATNMFWYGDEGNSGRVIIE